MLHLRLVLLVWFLALLRFRIAFGALINVTIDDTNPSVSGSTITYLPAGAWNLGTDCNGCAAHPNASQLFDGTWHDGTFNPLPGSNNFPNQTLTASVSFNGTAVYVFCALARTTTSPSGNSDMTFIIDGQSVGTFVKAAPGTTGYDYHFPVFSTTSLSPGNHTLTIQNGHVNGNKSLIILDSIVYSFDDGVSDVFPSSFFSSLSPPSSTSASASSATISSQAESSSSSKLSKSGVVAAAVVIPVVVVGLAIIVAAIFYCRRRRRQRIQEDIQRAEINPFNPFDPPTATAWSQPVSVLASDNSPYVNTSGLPVSASSLNTAAAHVHANEPARLVPLRRTITPSESSSHLTFSGATIGHGNGQSTQSAVADGVFHHAQAQQLPSPGSNPHPRPQFENGASPRLPDSVQGRFRQKLIRSVPMLVHSHSISSTLATPPSSSSRSGVANPEAEEEEDKYPDEDPPAYEFSRGTRSFKEWMRDQKTPAVSWLVNR